jgi:two-component system CheB/CheR fusion protein
MSQTDSGSRKPRFSQPKAGVPPEKRRSGPTDPPDSGEGFFVVGIGASAGGLDALKRFFHGIPAGSGCAFVVVLHLEPARESTLADLLSAQLCLGVEQARDGMEVQPDHVYLAPPAATLTIEKKVLRPAPRAERRTTGTPINVFLCSLAEDRQEKAIGVILSGNGSDGAAGLKEIKLNGGLTLAQQPDTAEYDSMPRAAIATGQVDVVLPAEQLPETILRYVQHPQVSQAAGRPLAGREEQSLEGILELLRQKGGFDFRCYKRSTLLRRLARRLGLRHVETLAGYAGILRQDSVERYKLIRDLLIGVTEFYRVPEAWKALEQEVIPPLLEGPQEKQPVRIWVAGCSTGQEAYSMAIAFSEARRKRGSRRQVQIFATDVVAEVLEKARAGTFSEEISANLPPALLKRYFTREISASEGVVYRADPALREMIVFAVQNLINDPPFSRLDLVSCRNLLIYLNPEAQKRLIRLFHFSLRVGGVLFLGNAEFIGGQEELFETVSKKWRIYRKLSPNRAGQYELPVMSSAERMSRDVYTLIGRDIPTREMRIGRTAQQILLEQFAPASLLIDRQFHVLYYFGEIDPYIQHPRGEPTHHLLRMARLEVRPVLRRTIQQASERNEETAVTFELRKGKTRQAVKLTARPVRYPGVADGLLLVSFRPEREREAPEPRPVGGVSAEGAIRQLDYELNLVREELRITMEEMKSSSEENSSINEELQSANEELEASKEELQLLNEELSTLNGQLEEKVLQLERTNNDLSNLLSSTDIAAVFLDRKEKLKLFTPAAGGLFHLSFADLGRHLSDIDRLPDDPHLIPEVRRVLESLAPAEREVRDYEGRWYIRRVLPYRTEDNRTEGVVVTFLDITERKRSEEELHRAKKEAQAANKAKSDFLAHMSHEIRTPISAVLGLSEVLLSQVHESEHRQFVSLIRESARSLLSIIGDVLDISRIESGKLEMHARDFDLRQMLEAQIGTFRGLAEKKGLALSWSMDPDVPRSVRGEVEKLSQVLRNLVSNAIKYTERGGVQVRVRRGVERETRVELRFEVQDSGIGIPKSRQGQLFESFSRVHESVLQRSKEDGTGLGLSIAKKLVELMGGRIGVESEEGKGSTFYFTLFLEKTPQTAQSEREGPLPLQALASVGPLSVLLVEDNPANRLFMQRALEETGHRVEIAEHGKQALEMLQQGRRFDLVLMDIQMPEMDGMEATRRIRALAGPAGKVPVIALTAFAMKEDEERILKAGASGYLSKPVDLTRLAELIVRLLSSSDRPPGRGESA